MHTIPTSIEGLVHLAPDVHGDERGFFVETYQRDRLAEAGIRNEFVQHNQSRSRMGTLRGLHYQAGNGQAKLVRVARGRILDVAVDLRESSPTFGRHQAFELDDVNHHQLYIPVGFAHGFLVLSEEADVCYLVSSYYDRNAERGVVWNDSTLAIDWPIAQPLLSPRDAALPAFDDVRYR